MLVFLVSTTDVKLAAVVLTALVTAYAYACSQYALRIAATALLARGVARTCLQAETVLDFTRVL